MTRAHGSVVLLCLLVGCNKPSTNSASAVAASAVAAASASAAAASVTALLPTAANRCYSPTQRVETAYEAESYGCACSAETERGVCVKTQIDGRDHQVGLMCIEGKWKSVEDGPCMPPTPLRTRGRVVLSVQRGRAAGELGFSDSGGADISGPSGFVVRDDGLVLVLDQENRRIQGFLDNKLTLSIALPVATYLGLSLLDDERVAALNPTAGGNITIASLSGKPLQFLPLATPSLGISESMTPGFYDLRRDAQGLWVKLSGDKPPVAEVQFLNAEGQAAPRVGLAQERATLSASGRYWFSFNRKPAQLGRRTVGEPPELKTVALPAAVKFEGSVFLGSDLSENIFVFGLVRKPDGAQLGNAYAGQLVVLDAALSTVYTKQIDGGFENVGMDKLYVTPHGVAYCIFESGSRVIVTREW